MSSIAIRAALETALNTMSPALATAWENTPYTPVAGTPYQRAYLLLADPDNREYGPNYQELGYLQVSLFYPLNTGPLAAYTRAELLRSTFQRGTSFSASGVTVTIQRTPSISPAFNDGDRFILPVKVRFFAHIIES